MPTHYQLLNVDEGAEPAAIRAAYKILIKRHHPDARGGDPDMASRLNEAYRVLSDRGRRADYDRTLGVAAAQRLRAHRAPYTPRQPDFDYFQMGKSNPPPAERRTFAYQGLEPGRDGFLGQKTKGNKWLLALAALCALLPVVFVLWTGPGFSLIRFGNDPAPAFPVAQSPSDSARPETGVMASPPDRPRVAPLVVTAAEGADQYLKLVDAATGRDVFTLYVRGGQTLQTRVPLGRYRVRYAWGQRWQGPQSLFGLETGTAAGNEILDFGADASAPRAYELRLVGQTDGNRASRAIPFGEF